MDLFDIAKLQKYEDGLEALREKWRSGVGSREIIKRQARALEIAKEIVLRKTTRGEGG